MKLTKQQKKDILPLLRRVVQGIIDSWDAQREIEDVVGVELDGMSRAAEDMAVGYGSPEDITIDEVQDYVDACRRD